MTDPAEALRKIREQWPKLDAAGLRRVFEAEIVDRPELRRAVIEQAFASALEQLGTAGAPPTSRSGVSAP